MNEFSRSALLLGKEAMQKLQDSRVIVFGVGGVGSYTVEALARSGVGTLAIVDADRVSLTNINRQLIATHSSLGRNKVEVMKERILDINPQCIVNDYVCFYGSDTASDLDLSQYDYIVDAIDTVSAKLLLIVNANKVKVPIISCMGAGNKLDPSRFEIADIFETSVCPLAKVMRSELRKRGIESLKVVYSKEPVTPPRQEECGANTEEQTGRRQIPGSLAFVPSTAGLRIASAVVYDLIQQVNNP